MENQEWEHLQRKCSEDVAHEGSPSGLGRISIGQHFLFLKLPHYSVLSIFTEAWPVSNVIIVTKSNL